MEPLNLNLDGFASPDELEEVGQVLTTLAAYAKTKARAMRDRAQGNITDALSQEQQCDTYYQTLPDWARW